MKIVFIGAGYVGLVSGTMLGYLGHDVTCCDNNKERIRDLQNGKLPIYEPDLDSYMRNASAQGRLRFSWEAEKEADAVFIAVGTPPLESGEADLSYIYEAVLQVAQDYSSDTIIVIKSTVPPSTCNALKSMLSKKGFTHEIASNPEFLREGSAIEDFLKPGRIVIGAQSEKAALVLREIYKPLTDQGFVLLSTDPTSSEFIKYASNAFLATKIGFINEMANLCEKVGADGDMLSEGMGLDHRIGRAFLKAGPGFGGSCFPKDLLALSYLAREHNQPCHVLDAVIFSNKHRPSHMVSKISAALGNLRGKNIGVLGITFKAGTDDVRSSPAVEIINRLIEQGALVRVYDPEGAKNGALLCPSASFAQKMEEVAPEAHAIVVLTEWDEFKELDFKKLRSTMLEYNIFDFRNILDSTELQGLGFNYYRIGK